MSLYFAIACLVGSVGCILYAAYIHFFVPGGGRIPGEIIFDPETMEAPDDHVSISSIISDE